MLLPVHATQTAGKFVELVAFAGFLVATTLFMSLNQKAFKSVFGSDAKKYWWLMLAFFIVPIMLMIYIFSLFFGPKPQISQIQQPQIDRSSSY